MDSKASAVWKGDLKGGSGTISANSGVLSGAAYTFATRFEGSAGTNPEELIAAAHAGCYSMALSHELASWRKHAGPREHHRHGDAGGGRGWIRRSRRSTLECSARVPGISQAAFDEKANGAKAGCPISKLMNAEISLNAVLES